MIKVFEMFAGYGGASFALAKANINFKCVGYSEIDKSAIKCYDMNHPNVKNYGDCTKINPNELPNFDLLTGGSRKLIDIVVANLKELNYRVAWKLLNSKDFGVPQSRARVWIVCFRENIYEPFKFQFPNEEPSNLVLKDILELNPSSKYNLSKKMIDGIKKSKFRERQPIDINKPCKTLKIGGDTPCFEVNYRRRFKDGKYLDNLSPTLLSSEGSGNDILIHSLMPRSSISGKGGSGHLSKNDGTSYCIDTGCSQAVEEKDVLRKLTPTECFRLMGFLNDEIKLDGLSDTAKYKLAGNGWEINLASKVLKNMLSCGSIPHTDFNENLSTSEKSSEGSA